KSAMGEVPDEHFHELFEDDSPAGKIADLVEMGRDPDERKTYRDMAMEIHMDSMTTYEPLLAMRDEPVSDEEREAYHKECGEYIEEAKGKLDKGDEGPSGILDWLRQMFSSLVSALFGEKSDGGTEPEKKSPKLTLLSDKVRQHAEDGDPTVLSQKTRPTPPALFGAVPTKEK
ncbi:MAG: hypothetical protein NZ659_15600, partial [Acidimicrobiales bacterium]|nr:hypothetical protein [Acidimicrobiales bacterium]